jgi:hypothetical protein
LAGILGSSALSLLAGNQTVTSGGVTESGGGYTDSGAAAALSVSGSGTWYRGTDLTISATGHSAYASGTVGRGVYVHDGAALSLTDSVITTTGTRGHGILLAATGSGAVTGLYLATAGDWACGVSATNAAALTLTGGTIRTAGAQGYGIYLYDHSSGTVRGADIATEQNFGDGVYAQSYSTLTLADSAIHTAGRQGYGIALVGTSSGTVRGTDITVTGVSSAGVYVFWHSTLALTDSNIRATGGATTALYLAAASHAAVNLNHNTLAGDLIVSATATLDLTGSNGSVITGNLTGTDHARVDLAITGADTALHGNISQDNASAIHLTVSAGALFHGSGTMSGLTLETGAILGYTGSLLVTGGPVSISDGIRVDFGYLTVEPDRDYLIIDYTNATGSVDAGSFTVANLAPDTQGIFTVRDNRQLYFTTGAVPEPSAWFLLNAGLGVVILAARRRRPPTSFARGADRRVQRQRR